MANPAALSEVARSLSLWRIWLRLGLQDMRLRFRRSAIGVSWIFLNLAVMILAIGFVYSHLFGQDLGSFIPYLTVGLIAWGYLTNSIVEGGNAFTSSEGYIKQISLPLYIYVMRFFVSIGLTSAITWVAYGLVALVYRVPVSAGTLWALPGLLLLMVTSLLLITIFAHLNARFRDAAHLAAVVMQVLFYVTPVIYPAELLRGRGLDYVIDVNPMYHLLEVVRRPLLEGEPAAGLSYAVTGLVIGALAVLAVVVIGYFRRRIVYSL
jgi:ABC-type polysaccharide/polyol phosphate export permease